MFTGWDISYLHPQRRHATSKSSISKASSCGGAAGGTTSRCLCVLSTTEVCYSKHYTVCRLCSLLFSSSSYSRLRLFSFCLTDSTKISRMRCGMSRMSGITRPSRKPTNKNYRIFYLVSCLSRQFSESFLSVSQTRPEGYTVGCSTLIVNISLKPPGGSPVRKSMSPGASPFCSSSTPWKVILAPWQTQPLFSLLWPSGVWNSKKSHQKIKTRIETLTVATSPSATSSALVSLPESRVVRR
eukprot:284819730_3